MRLIDADRLLNKSYHAYPSIEHYCLSRSVVDVKDINNAPTVEAEPVRHGHWTEHEWAEEDNGLLISNYECSCCHTWKREKSDYCPNCGTNMDEV